MLAVVLSLISVFFPHGLYNSVLLLGFDCQACFYSTVNIQKHSKHDSDGETPLLVRIQCFLLAKWVILTSSYLQRESDANGYLHFYLLIF
jgi:hypothetical protein